MRLSNNQKMVIICTGGSPVRQIWREKREEAGKRGIWLKKAEYPENGRGKYWKIREEGRKKRIINIF